MATPRSYLQDLKQCCDGMLHAIDEEKDDDLQILDLVSFHHRMNLDINAIMGLRQAGARGNSPLAIAGPGRGRHS